jgi:SAM-dependent methyltransferase
VPAKDLLPPPELMQRVGRIDDLDIAAAYDAIGHHSRARIERLLSTDWSWEGKRVLDFGCGAGRTLRHFLDEAEQAEFHGCDIDGPSISWLSEHLSPPLHVFQNGEEPRLPRPDGFFDLAYALSVFTHLGEDWAGWLLELHRVLKPGGLLVATFLNEAHWEIYGRGEWNEDRVGMNVIRLWNPWDEGGPVVFHSEWWIREHWGRAFEVLVLERQDPADVTKGQGAALLRRQSERLDADELERPSEDPRELAAARHNVEQLHEEAAELFAEFSRASESHEALARSLKGVQTELERLRAELAEIARSRSWRLTAPLRAATALLRKRDA